VLGQFAAESSWIILFEIALEKGQLKGMNELRESFWFDARAMHLRELPKRLAS
jgi:hypothetical protein